MLPFQTLLSNVFMFGTLAVRSKMNQNELGFGGNVLTQIQTTKNLENKQKDVFSNSFSQNSSFKLNIGY